MNRFKNYNKFFIHLDKTFTKFVYSFLLNLVFLCVFLVFLPLNYEMGDDVIIAKYTVVGSYNLGFENYFILWFIGAIQKLIYPINAYVIISLIFAFSAFFAITLVFIDKYNVLVSTSLVCLLYCFFGVNHFETISFTRIATLLSVAGFLSVLHFSRKAKWQTGIVFGVLLVILGSFFRFQIFEVCCVFVFLFVIVLSIREVICYKKQKRRFLSFIKLCFEPKRVIALFAILIICFVFNNLSGIINNSNNTVKNYLLYSSARSAVWDYPIPDYTECSMEYDKIGINQNDIDMLRYGYMDSEGAFSLEKLNEINAIKTTYNKEEKSIVWYVKLVKSMLASAVRNILVLSDRGLLYIAFALLLVFYCVILKKRNLMLILPFVFVIFAFYLYIYTINRIDFRVVYILWFASSIYLLYAISYDELRERFARLYNNRAVTTLAIVVVSLIIGVFGFFNSTNSNFDNGDRMSKTDIVATKKLYSELKKQGNKKYEIARSIFRAWYYPENMYFIDDNQGINYKDFLCVYYNYPQDKKDMKRILDTDNMYSNLYNSEVFFVDKYESNHTHMIQKYLQKYYSNGKTVKYKTVDCFNGFKIIKYSLE